VVKASGLANRARCADHGRTVRLNESKAAIIAMKRISCLAAAAALLVTLSGCDKKTSDDLKQKAEEAKRTVEIKAREAKDAADKQYEKAKPKLQELGDKAKEAAKDAQPKLQELGEKTKNAAQDGVEKMKHAVEKAKNAGSTATPTP
jgi:uncharacterized lipoprotein YehR (DUF1307 family)